jgi:transcription elongation factor GreA-like protein
LKQDLDIEEKLSVFEEMFGKLLLRTLHENDMSAVNELIEKIVENSDDIQDILEYA